MFIIRSKIKFLTLLAFIVLAAHNSGWTQDSLNVTRLGGLRWRGEGTAIDVQGNYACVAIENGAIQIIDVSNPALPEELGFATISGYAQDIAVSGNYA